MDWTDERKADVARRWTLGERTNDIAAHHGTNRGVILRIAAELGLPRRPRGRPPKARDEEHHHDHKQRRHRPAPAEGARIRLEPHHPASRAGTTIFASTVLPSSRADRVLKSGHNSRKIGAVMTKGRWKGQPVFTLTLEERATCPRSCKAWATCYGNNMHFAQRMHDDGTLELKLITELACLLTTYPNGIVVRLHVLGDFYSVGYVAFWRMMLERHHTLTVFGFTARLPPDPIGNALVLLTRDYYDRFRMRFSGAGHGTDCSEIITRREDARGIVCPAQLRHDICCATCALCLTSNRTISFLEH